MSDEGPIDYSGQPRSLGEKRDYGFQMMKAHMLEVEKKRVAHMNPLSKGSHLNGYAKALNDAWSVFAQIVEVPTDEELTPG